MGGSEGKGEGGGCIVSDFTVLMSHQHIRGVGQHMLRNSNDLNSFLKSNNFIY